MAENVDFMEDTTPTPVSLPVKPAKVKRGKKDPQPAVQKDPEPAASNGTTLESKTANAPRPPPRESTEVTSLSFDQVNDNADELVELRGEGRYFGVTDPASGDAINAQQSLGPLCGNCHRRGHIRAKCKTVVCHKCGVVGDHYETQCPTTMVCAKCGLKGHIAVDCVNKAKKRTYCRLCDTFLHGDETCPSIWRLYLTLPTASEETVLPVVFCYNCGAEGHYGDECTEYRTLRVPNQGGSAFSGSNLPKHLRELYYETMRNWEKHSYSKSYNSSGNFSSNYGKSYNGSGNYNSNYNSGYNPSYNSSYGSAHGAANYGKSTLPANPRDFTSKTPHNPSRSQNSASSSRNAGPSRNASSRNYENPQPSRNGYIKAKNDHQPSRSGVIKGKVTKPHVSRSGLIEASGRGKKKAKNLGLMY